MQLIKTTEERKKWLKEKDIVLIFSPAYSDDMVKFEVCRVSEFDPSDMIGYKGKIQIVERTNKWIEALPEI